MLRAALCLLLSGSLWLLGAGKMVLAGKAEDYPWEIWQQKGTLEDIYAQKVILGDEDFDSYLPLLEGKRVALFSNHTGIVGNETSWDLGPGMEKDPTLVPLGTDGYGREAVFGEHILDALLGKGVNVVCIFSPEHGFRGNADAGENVDSSVDEKTGLPIFSLYTKGSHYPSQKDMDAFDTLVIDLQDVGLRYYTYHISMYYLMDACAQQGKNVVLLDRPNPNGFYMDGPILQEEFQSGVGILPIPVVYGLTWGELAQMINGEGWLVAGANALDLTVIPCQGYTHATKTFLIMPPSPNLKDMRAVYLYASTCCFENTVVSVGRGTSYPFETYGSIYLEGVKPFSYCFTPESMPGAANPPYLGETCYGKSLRDKPIEEIWEEGISLSYLIEAYQAVKEAHPEVEFFYPDSPRWIDRLFGTDSLRLSIEAGESAQEIKEGWREEILSFQEKAMPYLLYS